MQSKGYLEELEKKREDGLDRNFGLRSQNLRVAEHEVEEIEESEDLALKRFRKAKAKANKIPWYLLNENCLFSKI